MMVVHKFETKIARWRGRKTLETKALNVVLRSVPTNVKQMILIIIQPLVNEVVCYRVTRQKNPGPANG